MAVGMSPVHWQLAGSSALAHDSVSVPVPRGRDHRLRATPSSALAPLEPGLPRELRFFAGTVHRILKLRRRLVLPHSRPQVVQFLHFHIRRVLAGPQHIHHDLRLNLGHRQSPPGLHFRPVRGVLAPVALFRRSPLLRSLAPLLRLASAVTAIWSVSSRGLSFPAGFFVSPPGLPLLFGAGLAPGLSWYGLVAVVPAQPELLGPLSSLTCHLPSGLPAFGALPSEPFVLLPACERGRFGT